MTIYQMPGIMQIIQTEFPADVKKKSLLQKMEDLFATAYKQEYLTNTQRSSEEFVDRIWLYASLVDAALGKKTYAAEKYGCANEWDQAVRWIKFELNRRKLFSGVMIHDVARLCSMANDSLECLNASSCGQSIVDRVKSSGESLTALYENIHDLKSSLSTLAETYEKYQLSLEN